MAVQIAEGILLALGIALAVLVILNVIVAAWTIHKMSGFWPWDRRSR